MIELAKTKGLNAQEAVTVFSLGGRVVDSQGTKVTYESGFEAPFTVVTPPPAQRLNELFRVDVMQLRWDDMKALQNGGIVEFTVEPLTPEQQEEVNEWMNAPMGPYKETENDV